MRSRASFQGHPIHPMLIPFPFAFLTGAFAFNAFGWYSSSHALSLTGEHLTLVGIGAGLLAAVPGIIDYANSVPPRSSAKTRATRHALLNVTALVLFGVSWMTHDVRLASLPVLAEQAVGVALLGVAGYMGGTLVYRNQMGVDHRYADAGKWREVGHHRVEGPVIVGNSADLKVNQLMLVRLDEQRIAVGRIDDGCRAFDDRCTHKGGPLSDGALICGTVQCPWHGSQFDVATGEVKAGPATKKIATHRVAESNGQIRVG
jgi:nitrite reductase/ring-hydroxylating ferredoxin subunit/uncharacterized membrane protein